tara:strand:+ start:143 stop:580 length:438 start_codon:yes stop_codon:yes gene_type:complete
MAKISSYSTTTPVLTDKLIGTDVGGTPADATKNFLLSDVQTLFKSGIALSDVLAAGNTATANIVLTGDITATGTVTGATVTSTGDVNATHVFSTTVRTTVLEKAVGTDLHIGGLDTYADQAAAIAGGLVVDCIYMTATGELRIVL